MRPYLKMRSRRSVELLLLLLVSCSPYRDLPELGESSFKESGLHAPYEELDRAVIYKTRAGLYDRNFSGLLYVKRTGERSYRIAFTSEMGMSFFDFRFERKRFEVEHCMDRFDRRAVISRIRQDMRLLLMCTFGPEAKGERLEGRSGERIWKAPKGADGIFYYHMKDGALKKGELVDGWRRKKKVIMHLSDLKGTVPGKVHFEHLDIDLDLRMRRVN